MGDSKQDVNRKFNEIVSKLGYRPGIAEALCTFLDAAPGQQAVEPSAIDYAVSKLWTEEGS